MAFGQRNDARRMVRYVVLGLMMLVLALTIGIRRSRSVVDQSSPGESLRRAIAAQGRDDEATRLIREAFKNSSEDTLLKLRNHQDPGISIAAAYRLVRANRPTKPMSGDPQGLIGFLEGRTNLICPPRWAWGFVFRACNHSCDPGPKPESERWHQVEFAGDDVYVPADTEVYPDRVVVADESVPVSAALGKSVRMACAERKILRSGSAHCRFVIADQVAYLAVWDRSSLARFPLLAINGRTGDVLWTSEVWAHWEDSDHYGGVHREVDLVANGDLVGVFGSTPGSADYVEAFDVANGHAALRVYLWLLD